MAKTIHNTNKKFEELILYVSQRSADDQNFGSIKLNKIVAYAEMIHFATTGKPITDARYMKQPMGVVARNMKPALVELGKKRELALVPRERYGRIAKVPTALRQADISQFKATEVAAVEQVLSAMQGHNGSSVSELSHRLTPNWDYLPVNAEIPVSALLYPSEYTLTPEENSHFKQLLRDTDWGRGLANAEATA